MGVIRVTDEVQRVIERQVLDGRTPNAAAFVEEAVLRLVNDRYLPIRLFRMRMPRRLRIGAPKHLVIYRVFADTVEILGLVHDRMVLSRAAHAAVYTLGGDDAFAARRS